MVLSGKLRTAYFSRAKKFDSLALVASSHISSFSQESLAELFGNLRRSGGLVSRVAKNRSWSQVKLP